MQRWLDVARLRLRSLVHRDRVDDELDRELRAHLEAQVEENIARGMPPADARRVALSKLIIRSVSAKQQPRRKAAALR